MTKDFGRKALYWLPAVLLGLLAGLSIMAGGVEALLGVSSTGVDLSQRFLPPSLPHFLGTDELGRDVFARLLRGGQVSLTVGVTAAAAACGIGTLVGLVAGYLGGRTDALLMRITDLLIALPALPLLIVLAAIDLEKLGVDAETAHGDAVSLYRIVLLIALLGWTAVARLVRARTLQLRESDFIRAARALGVTRLKIIWRHVLPNVGGIVIIAATLAVGHVILMESVLSFLGLGIQPPLPSWGNMLTQAEDVIWEHPQLMIWPGVMIFATVLCCNLLGDSLQDRLNPKGRTRR